VKHPERAIQSHIVRLLRSLGGQVFVLGTTRRRGDHPGTMMSAGLPDVIAFLPTRSGERQLLVVEAKAPRGRMRPAQLAFRQCCLDAHVAHVAGDLDAVIAWLVQVGYLQAKNVPHYRAKKEGEAV